MKLLKSKPFAIGVMVAAIFLAIAFSAGSNPPMPEGGVALDQNLPTAEYEMYIVDEANVLSKKIEKQLSIYNANWVELAGRIMAVVTVEHSADLESDAWYWGDYLGLYDDDALLLIDVGSESFTVVAVGSFYDTLAAQPSGFLDDAMYADVRRGDYDAAVLNLFAQVHLLHDSYSYSVSFGSARAGLIFMLILLVVFIIMICSLVDSMRYSSWNARYGSMAAPPVVYRPILWWHRPGSIWYRRRRMPPPPPGPHHHGGPRPPMGGGGYRPPTSGHRPPSSSRPGGSFSSSRGGSFSGGRSGSFSSGRGGSFSGGRSGGFSSGRGGSFSGGRGGGFSGGRGGSFGGGSRGGSFGSRGGRR